MKRVLTAVVLIPVVLLVVFKAPLWLFALAIAAIVMLSLHEYLNIIKGYGIEPIVWLTYAVSIFVVAGLVILDRASLMTDAFPWDWSLLSSPALLFMLPVIFGVPLVFRADMRMSLPAAASSAFGVLYIAVSLALLLSLRRSFGNEYLLVFTLLSVWGGDTAAYYVGRSLGRHKLAPIVSPKKTWEGAIASVVASILIAALVFNYRDAINSIFAHQPQWGLAPGSGAGLGWPSVIVLGFVTNVAAQFGDLFESTLKRGANIKDSGTLLPGHGGILDRIDALLFAIPVVWYYATFTGLTQHLNFYHPLNR